MFLSDSGKITSYYRQMLVDENIPFEEQQHTMELIINADEVVKSPGIPPTAPVVREVISRRIPVISEIE